MITNFETIVAQLEKNFGDLKRLNKALRVILKPQNILKKKLLVKLENGRRKSYKALYVQHSNTLGQYLGEIYLHDSWTNCEVNTKESALKTGLKLALFKLPLSGACGGISCDSTKLSTRDIKTIYRQYILFLSPHLGAWKNIIKIGDLKNYQYTGFIIDTLEKRKKSHSPASVLNKPFELGGLEDLERVNRIIKNKFKLKFNNKIPELILGSEHLISGYIEWLQGIRGFVFNDAEIKTLVTKIINPILEEVVETSKNKKISFEDACYYLSLKRLIDILILKGRV